MRNTKPGGGHPPGPEAIRRGWGQPNPPRRYPPLYPPVKLTDHQLAGARAAAVHLLAHRLPPLFPVYVIRALWHRDPALATILAKIRGIAP